MTEPDHPQSRPAGRTRFFIFTEYLSNCWENALSVALFSGVLTDCFLLVMAVYTILSIYAYVPTVYPIRVLSLSIPQTTPNQAQAGE
jgi:hypothetical protein